jgi:NAD(P)H-hydrate repair Nnr-like enzyme with NAD(P)H-hydrate epimerase domain
MMVLAGGGDGYFILKHLRHQNWGREALYCDHPKECGFVVFEK